MRLGIFVPIAMAGLLVLPAGARAQSVGDAITVTGCLTRENDDGEASFEFDEVTEPHQALDEVELVPSPGLVLDDHVGHVIRVSGFVIPDEDDKQGDEDDDEDEITVRVTRVAHVLGQCDLED